jgi:hypothetical protein
LASSGKFALGSQSGAQQEKWTRCSTHLINESKQAFRVDPSSALYFIIQFKDYVR